MTDETMTGSAELFAAAEQVLPGGVGSSARGVRAGWAPYPPFVASGRGSRVTDVDGNEYVDYLMGLGPLLFGHRPPEITAAVVAAIQELGHGVRPAVRAGGRGRAQGDRRGPERRHGALRELRQRGGGHGRAAGARGHRPEADPAVRGALPRVDGHGVLEQPSGPVGRRPGRHGRCRSRPVAGCCPRSPTPS